MVTFSLLCAKRRNQHFRKVLLWNQSLFSFSTPNDLRNTKTIVAKTSLSLIFLVLFYVDWTYFGMAFVEGPSDVYRVLWREGTYFCEILPCRAAGWPHTAFRECRNEPVQAHLLRSSREFVLQLSTRWIPAAPWPSWRERATLRSAFVLVESTTISMMWARTCRAVLSVSSF